MGRGLATLAAAVLLAACAGESGGSGGGAVPDARHVVFPDGGTLFDAPARDGSPPRRDGPADLVHEAEPREGGAGGGDGPLPDAVVVDQLLKLLLDTAPGRTCRDDWSLWTCTQNASPFCSASCGSDQLSCLGTVCFCQVSGQLKTCAPATQASCGSCDSAFSSGCCL